MTLAASPARGKPARPGRGPTSTGEKKRVTTPRFDRLARSRVQTAASPSNPHPSKYPYITAMKSSLKVLLSVLALGCVASTPVLLAQDAPPAGGGQRRGGGRGQMSPAQQVERLEQAVGKLTDDQKTKITAVYEKAQKDMQALSQEDRRTKGQELRQAAMKEIRALLTEDQQKKFDAMPQGRGPGGGGQRRGGGNGN